MQWPGGDIQSELMYAFLWLSLAIFVVSYFDISMPRGDTLGVSGALAATALIVCESPMVAVAAALGGTLLAVVCRRSLHVSAVGILPVMLAEAAGLVFGLLAYLVTPATAGGLLRAAAVVIAFLAAELAVGQFLVSLRTQREYSRLLVGTATTQAPLLAAQVSAVLLATITYPTMGHWSLLLVIALLLLIRQSYALYWGIRDTYRATVEVLVEAAEGSDSRLRGHAERTAKIAREIAHACGYRSADIERISYAALLHDVDALGAGEGATSGHSSRVLEGVGLFDDVVRILALREGRSVDDASAGDVLAAYIVSLSSDIDMENSPTLQGCHVDSVASELATLVSSAVKARAVASAIRLGYRIPAVS